MCMCASYIGAHLSFGNDSYQHRIGVTSWRALGGSSRSYSISETFYTHWKKEEPKKYVGSYCIRLLSLTHTLSSLLLRSLHHISRQPQHIHTLEPLSHPTIFPFDQNHYNYCVLLPSSKEEKAENEESLYFIECLFGSCDAHKGMYVPFAVCACIWFCIKWWAYTTNTSKITNQQTNHKWMNFVNTQSERGWTWRVVIEACIEAGD